MGSDMNKQLTQIHDAMKDHLFNGIVPFWSGRVADEAYGGFLTNFDEAGRPEETPEKNAWSQARLIWFFSHLCRRFGVRDDWAALARAGVDFMIERFWDTEHGGWYCRLRRDGSILRDNKIVYDQSFAIYALAEFFLAFGDERSLVYASDTFDLLQNCCTDTVAGGYHEYFGRDWRVSAAGDECGDLKSLDAHMHLMEAFTTLCQATGRHIHRRKVVALMELIVRHMIDPEFGCGRNQFDPAFRATPGFRMPVALYPHEHGRDHPDQSIHYTSYGHNIELAWLMRRAIEVTGQDIGEYREIIRGLLDHTAGNGIDREHGGLYRFGLHCGEPLIKEKEYWQHAEALIGFLDGYEAFGESAYAQAFFNIWRFVDTHLINYDVGEWREVLDRRGRPLEGELGRPHKVAYHTGRAMIECTLRLETLLNTTDASPAD